MGKSGQCAYHLIPARDALRVGVLCVCLAMCVVIGTPAASGAVPAGTWWVWLGAVGLGGWRAGSGLE